MYYIYSITNLINYKVYIGQTHNPKHRWSSHKYEMRRGVLQYTIYKALRKYGVDNFQFCILEVCLTEAEIDVAEQYWIKMFESQKSETGYNLAVGGNVNRGWHHSEVSKNKISNSQKGKIVIITDETKKKMSLSKIGHFVSKETKDKMSKKHKGDQCRFAKLNWELVRKIRLEYKNTNINQTELAAKYGVNQSTMNSLIQNKTWKE